MSIDGIPTPQATSSTDNNTTLTAILNELRLVRRKQDETDNRIENIERNRSVSPQATPASTSTGTPAPPSPSTATPVATTHQIITIPTFEKLQGSSNYVNWRKLVQVHAEILNVTYHLRGNYGQ